MSNLEINGKDLLLSFLYSPGLTNNVNEHILGRTRLTKMMFIFQKEIQKYFLKDLNTNSCDFYHFTPYLFGPFSSNLFEDLAFFVTLNMIRKEPSNIPITKIDAVEENYLYDNDEADPFHETENFEMEYFLTDLGIKYCETKIWPNFSQNQKDILKQFKHKINGLSLDNILDYVYNKYKEFTINSVIADNHIKA